MAAVAHGASVGVWGSAPSQAMPLRAAQRQCEALQCIDMGMSLVSFTEHPGSYPS